MTDARAKGDDTQEPYGGDKRILVDLEGYKDVYISWLNIIEQGYLDFYWVLKDEDDTVRHVVKFLSDGYNELGESRNFKVHSKYLEIWVGSYRTYDPRNPSDEVRIILYATK